MIEVLIYGFILIFIYFLLFYLIALKQGIYNTVDIAYGSGFILISLLALFLSNNFEVLQKILVTGLITLWGIRIASFLTFRKYGKDENTNEDKRFKIMRDRWGKSATWKGLVFLYLPQVFIVIIVALPVLVINYYSTSTDLTLFDLVGGIVVFIGIMGESVSDFQLNQFKKNLDNKGKVYTGGLWKYSQHPNYFFEIVTWWGFWIIAIFAVPLNQFLWAIVSILGPIVITLSLLKVSGVPLLNRRFGKVSEYSEYQKRTSLLIPWFPKK